MEAQNYDINKNNIYIILSINNNSQVEYLINSAMEIAILHISNSINNSFRLYLHKEKSFQVIFPLTIINNQDLYNEERMIQSMKINKIKEKLIERINTFLMSNSQIEDEAERLCIEYNLNSVLSRILLEINAYDNQEKIMYINSQHVNSIESNIGKDKDKENIYINSRIIILTDICYDLVNEQKEIKNKITYDNKLLYLIKKNKIPINILHYSSVISSDLELISFLTSGYYQIFTNYNSSTMYYIQILINKEIIHNSKLSYFEVETISNRQSTNSEDEFKRKLECSICGSKQDKIYLSTTENIVRCDISKDCSKVES